MIPDIRKTVAYDPPHPQWLKYLYFATVAICLVSGLGFAAAWKSSHSRMEAVRDKHAKIEQAMKLISENNRTFDGLEASRQIRESRNNWRNSAVPTVSIQTAAQLAVVETEASLIKLADEESKKEAKNPRKRRRPPSARDIPDLIIKSMEVDVRNDTLSPELRITIAHNTSSRELMTRFHAELTKFMPSGYQLQNYRTTEERANQVTFATTWAKP